MKAIPFLFMTCAGLLSARSVAVEPTSHSLRAELIRMKEADQSARSLRLEDEDEIRVLTAIDAVNTARLKSIVAESGWPSQSLVGSDGAEAAWLLAQHADADPAFQRSVLALIEPLVAAGEVKASSYAYLWDRTHDPQRYGTQGRCRQDGKWEPRAIEDPDHVDARRAQVGLSPMAEYRGMVSKHCPRD